MTRTQITGRTLRFSACRTISSSSVNFSTTGMTCLPILRASIAIFFKAEDGIRYDKVTGVQTCALPIFDRLTEAMQQVFASPAYQAGLKKLGNEPFPLTPAQGAAFIKAEVDKWAAVAKSANIQVD